MRPVPPLKACPDGKGFKLLAPMDVVEYSIVVPMGFVTDLASVPWFARWLVPTWGKFSAASIVHDWLYFDQPCSREEADTIFAELMKADGVRASRRMALVSGVRAGGWVAWRKHANTA